MTDAANKSVNEAVGDTATELQIGPDSLVTLRYSLSCGDEVLVSTLESRPATLQMGTGELAPPFEQCLFGLTSGTRQVFDLPPAQAFGSHNAQWVQQVSRTTIAADVELAVGGLLAMTMSDGQQATGTIREVTSDFVVLDFNHPLAGKTLRFEVDVVGVL